MDDQVFSKLRRVLRKYFEHYGSWSRLSEALHKANGYDRDRKIDRRTLKTICESEHYSSVRLTIGQLIALDRFFSVADEGRFIARSESLIDAIAESPDVNFLVSAKYVEALGDYAVARWDLGVVTWLLRTPINRLVARIWEVTDSENWKSIEAQIKNAANIFVASPVASYATEVALSTMIGIEPGVPCPRDKLPFAIIGAERDEDLESNFVRSRSEAAREDPRIEKRLDPDLRGLLIGDDLYCSTERTNYALIAAQRDRESGQVQAVLCGLAGPGTYFLARILQGGGPQKSLPLTRSGEEHPRILLAAYQLAMDPESLDQGRGRATRKVASAKLVYGPELIQYAEGAWQIPERR
jgi:hypothetical protein